MPQATFVQDGMSIDYTPGAAVPAGEVVVQGELVGIAKFAIAANALGSLSVEGVYDLPKATGGGSAITAGATLYPRIQAVASRGSTDTRTRAKGALGPQHLSMLNYDALYFELEKFKRERSWYNLNVPKEAIRPLLADASWYTLYSTGCATGTASTDTYIRTNNAPICAQRFRFN